MYASSYCLGSDDISFESQNGQSGDLSPITLAKAGSPRTDHARTMSSLESF